MIASGKHILVEFEGCDADILNDPVALETAMVAAAKVAGTIILHQSFHRFAPQGVSGVVLIQESHLTVHTWPEYGYAAVDLFTCGEHVDPWSAFSFLKKVFHASKTQTLEIIRGIGMQSVIKNPPHARNNPQEGHSTLPLDLE